MSDDKKIEVNEEFLDQLLETPPAPSPALVEAMARYQDRKVDNAGSSSVFNISLGSVDAMLEHQDDAFLKTLFSLTDNRSPEMLRAAEDYCRTKAAFAKLLARYPELKDAVGSSIEIFNHMLDEEMRKPFRPQVAFSPAG